MKKTQKYIAILALALAASCAKEITVQEPVNGSGTESEFTVSLSDGTVQTKGIVATASTESLVDSRLSGATVGIYSNGILAATATPSGAAVTLDKKKTYNFYALSGYGISWTWPESESALPSMAIELDEDFSLYRFGIPCFGSLTDMTPEEADASDGSSDGNVRLDVRRLFAKLKVTIDPSGLDFLDFSNVSLLRVRNMNKALRPFAGPCAAASASDIRDYSGKRTDYEGAFSASGGSYTAIIYIPENMQGTLLPGNTDPRQKTPAQVDNVNGSGRSSLCTYVEFYGDGLAQDYVDHVNNNFGGDWSGMMVQEYIYRFMPGLDATTNFDVEGGREYDIHAILTEGGIKLYSWKTLANDYTVHSIFSFFSPKSQVAPGKTAYVEAVYGTIFGWDEYSFRSPLWGEPWGFYGGTLDQYNAWCSSGTLVSDQVHLYGHTVVCPDCGSRYPGFPSGDGSHSGLYDTDVTVYGAPFVASKQRTWLETNLTHEHSGSTHSFKCPYCESADILGPGVTFSDTEYSSSAILTDADIETFEPEGAEHCYLWVDIPSSAPIGSTYRIYGGDHYKSLMSYCDIRVGRTIPARFDTETLPTYVAQQGSVTATQLPEGVSGVTYSVKSQSAAGVLSVEDGSSSAANLSCTVRAMKAGTAVISVKDRTTSEEVATITANVSAPVIVLDGNPSDIHYVGPEGTATTIGASYYTTDGFPMSVAGSDADGNKTKFAPSLYASWLEDPVAGSGTAPQAACFGFSGAQVYLKRFSAGGSSVTPGTTYDSAVVMKSSLCADVLPVAARVGVKPLYESMGTPFDEKVDDYSAFREYNNGASVDIVNSRIVKKGKLLYGNAALVIRNSLKTNVPKEYCDILLTPTGYDPNALDGNVYFDNLSVSWGNNGTVIIKLEPSGSSRAVGKTVCLFVVTNFRSGEKQAVPIGTMEIFMHTALVGRIDPAPGQTWAYGIYVYPLGYENIPSALKEDFGSFMEFKEYAAGKPSYNRRNFPVWINNTNGYSVMVPVTLQYTATGTVDYSPGAPVYEVDFEPESQIEGEISHKDFIRAVYDIESPYVAVKNLVLHPFTGLSQPDVGKNVFRYALGGSTADDDKGYYVIEYMWECDQSRHGWVDFDDVMAGRRNYPNS